MRRMSAARLGLIRRWPYSWSERATDEQATPVNAAAKSANPVSSPSPVAVVTGMETPASTAICTVTNGIVCNRLA